MRTRNFLALLLVAAELLSVLYLWVTPPWMGPDEPRHYEYVRLLYDKRRLVGWSDAEPALEAAIAASMRQHRFEALGIVRPGLEGQPLPDRFADIWGAPLAHQLHQPPLAYLLYAAALAPVADAPIERQLFVLRLVSLIIGLATTLVMAVALLRLWEGADRTIGLAAAALAALLPQRLWLSVTVSNDPLTFLWGALAFLLLVDGWRRGWRWWHLPGLLLALGLGLLTKRTILPLVGLLIGALLLALGEGRWRRGMGRGVVVAGGVGVALLVALPLLWGLLAAQLPGFATWAGTMAYIYVGHVIDPMANFQYEFNPAAWFTPAEAPFWWRYLRNLVETFWGRFGWLTVWLGTPVRLLLTALTALGLVGIGRQLWRLARGEATLDPAPRLALLSGVGALLVSLAVMLQRLAQDWASDPRPSFQMRFLFPILPLLASYLVWGLWAWVPQRRQMAAVALWSGSLFLLNLYAIFFRLLPAWRLG